ncbi:GNAT family N-acetyltransferase [Chloroflexota bacterium]
MSYDLKGLYRLNRSHIKSTAKILTRAFWSYPVSVYAYPDELTRGKRLPYFFQFVLHYCVKYGEVYAPSSEIQGVAVWLAPDKFPMTIWRLLRSVPLPVMFNLGLESGKQMKPFNDYVDGVHKQLTPFKHWFLQVIGIDPCYQGKGYASKLLEPMLARIDKEGLSCYLETIDERNVSLYEHFGFRVVDESIVPHTELTNWAMLREAR